MRTIIATLGPQDRLAVVTFSNAVSSLEFSSSSSPLKESFSQATVLMELTSMSDGGRATAERVVRDIKANGSTNLWDGLVSGLDVLRKSPGIISDFSPSRFFILYSFFYISGSRPNRTVLLLTDGEPNIVPPRGHQAMLKNYMVSSHYVVVIMPLAPSLHSPSIGCEWSSWCHLHFWIRLSARQRTPCRSRGGWPRLLLVHP